MSTSVVLQQMLVIIILIAIGYALFKKGFVTDEGSKTMSFLVLTITNPAVCISSAFSEEVEITHWDIIMGLIIGAAMYAFLIVFGHLFSALLTKDNEKRRTYAMLQIYANVGFIGIPVTSAVLGEHSLVFVTVSLIIYNILFYTHGYSTMLSGRKDVEYKFTWKSLINVGTVSGVIAILVFWFRLRFPEFIEATISSAGKATTFMAMIVLGISIAKIPLKSLIGDKKLYLIWAVRYLLVPIAFALVLKNILGSSVMVDAFAILMAMPVGNMPLMLANQYGLETETFSAATFLTTILSVFTVTLTTMVL
jgi:predicted permease